MIFLHPIAAATRVNAPILSGVRTLSKITVIGAELSFGFSLMAIFISSKSNVAKEKGIKILIGIYFFVPAEILKFGVHHDHLKEKVLLLHLTLI